MGIWGLETDTGFTSFKFLFEEDKAFFCDLVKQYFDQSKPVNENWRVLLLRRDEPKKFPDFFSIDETDVIAISQNAVNKLSLFLTGNIELLPLQTDSGVYYAMNVLNFVDCLDKKESKYEVTNNGAIINYTFLDFIEKSVGENKIFKIPEMPYRVLITQDFAFEIEEEGFKGLFFDSKNNLLWHNE